MHQHQPLALAEQPGGILADSGEIQPFRPAQLDYNDNIIHSNTFTKNELTNGESPVLRASWSATE